ncbi:MAG: hypothetical protein JW744_04790 [Candidatus Diapherotrites archaeon]|uniref:Uncharacterized protein n=1 Tax=Candidatus Iainarchaeum sp. TaxID=3101447 RepID=A0A939C7K6_9ARCH|nr:hypothetical protein [Candidatus Diapherotrites archaeon]
MFNGIALIEKYRAEFYAIALFFLLTCLFFLPIVLAPNSSMMGTFGDPCLAMRTPFLLEYNMRNGVNSTRSNLVNAPFGVDISQLGLFLPFTFLIFLPLSMLTTQLFAYNLIIFSGPFLGAIVAFFLARHFIKSKPACFLSGLIYGFSPFVLVRSTATLNIAQTAWIALFVLALFRFDEKRNSSNAIVLAVTLALTGFFSHYYLFFSVLFLAIFYLYRAIIHRNELMPRARKAVQSPVQFLRETRHFILALIVFLLIFSLTILPLITTMANQSDADLFKSALGGRTNMMNIVYLSAWPTHFVTPPVYHPLFGSTLLPIVQSSLVGMNFIGATVYVGLTAIALALVAIFKRKNQSTLDFFLFALMAVFILAIGPFVRYISIFGVPLAVAPLALALYSRYKGKKLIQYFFTATFFGLIFFPLLYPVMPLFQDFAVQATGIPQLKDAPLTEVIEHLEKYDYLPIPMPSFFIFRAVPFFRAYARLTVLLMLCLAVLAGFGAEFLLERVRGANKKSLLTIAFAALILLEFANFPPYPATDVSETPPVYEWLAEQPGDFIVAEYPLEWNNFYVFYQLKHKKPLLNGQYSVDFQELEPRIRDLSQDETLSILAGLGVKYVITHNMALFDLVPDSLPDKVTMLRWMSNTPSFDFTEQFESNYPAGFQGVKLIKRFEDSTVYEITAEPKHFSFD